MSLPSYLLDTSVIVALLGGKELGARIDEAYGLRKSPLRPLVCVVTHGELKAMARVNKLGPTKVAATELALGELTTIDLHDQDVLRAYAEIYDHLRSHPKGSRTNMGENDMWIAAATRAANATLLTLDTDFDALFPAMIQRVYIQRQSPVVS
ncbi:MAG: PIN domain-containing protein [Myxococcales bacterium]|nr:PIN domain-containing protein [Myxococcales bacterium]